MRIQVILDSPSGSPGLSLLPLGLIAQDTQRALSVGFITSRCSGKEPALLHRRHSLFGEERHERAAEIREPILSAEGRVLPDFVIEF